VSGKRSKDPSILQTYLSYGVDLFHRRVYLGYLDGAGDDDIGFESIALAVRGIDKLLDLTNKEPIEIHCCSYGGSPYHSLALVDKILESPCKFVFYGRGAIMSAATVIMAVCDERYVSRNSTIMLHDGSDGFEGKTTDMQIYVKEAERVQDAYNEIYANNSWLDKTFWDSIVRRDLYLTADEALSVGLVDKIVHTPGRSKFRSRKKPTSSDHSRIGRLMKKFSERTKMPILSEVKLHFIEDKHEDIKEYDNTENELKKLNDESGQE
jgi:ATP-dependent protease ClpP protease subunit